VFAGAGKFCNASGPLAVPTEGVGWADTKPPVEAENRSLVLFDRGDEVTVQAGPEGIRFLLVSGKPLQEPVAWYGPIVMNTQEQLRQAFEELEQGTFLKRSWDLPPMTVSAKGARALLPARRVSRPAAPAPILEEMSEPGRVMAGGGERLSSAGARWGGGQVDSRDRASLQEDLTALARGKRAAFDPLFRKVWPLLRGFALRCLPAGEAEDAAQEALLRVFARASEFDPERDALAWILGIAAWQIRTHRARSRRRREEPATEIPERLDAAPTPEEAAIARDLAFLLDGALSRLPPGDAATLLAYARGERPDLPGPTFRKRVERALGRLRLRWRLPRGSS
jgi:RNA polymerase sigma factor (sigma-70 family)